MSVAADPIRAIGRRRAFSACRSARWCRGCHGVGSTYANIWTGITSTAESGPWQSP